MTTKHKIAIAAVLVGAASVISKIFGFLREMLIAAYFGASGLTDAFVISQSIAEFIRDIVAGGAISAAFIPLFTESLSQNGKNTSFRLSNTLLNIEFVCLVLLALLSMAFSPLLVKIIAPGFSGESHALSVNLIRIIMPSIVFMGMASLSFDILNSFRHFLAPSIGKIMINLGVITGILVLAGKYGVYGLAIGYLFGGILQFLAQIPALYKEKYVYRFQIDVKSESFKKLALLWVPLTFCLILSTLNAFVVRFFGSLLPEGNVAALNFANRIRETPWVIVGVTLGHVVFPYLSWQINQDDKSEFNKTILWSIKLIFWTTFPICCLLVVFRIPIIALLFQRGAFDINDTILTSKALSYYSLGALALSLNYVVIRVYYAIKDIKTILYVSAASLAVNIILCKLLIKSMGIGGLALAQSVSESIIFISLLFVLFKKYRHINMKDIVFSFAVIVIVSAVSVLPGKIAYEILNACLVSAGPLSRPLVLVLSLITFAVVYLLMNKIFRVREYRFVENLILEKLRRKK